jgi:hypothetical protein
MLTIVLNPSSLILSLLMFALFIVGEIVLYKIISKPVVKSSCLDYGFAFRISSRAIDEQIMIFNFDSERY